jgi:hypothetical protein
LSCPSWVHARDVRRVAGCLACGLSRAAKDPRSGKSPARKLASKASDERRVTVPASIHVVVSGACDAVRRDPSLASKVERSLVDVFAADGGGPNTE